MTEYFSRQFWNTFFVGLFISEVSVINCVFNCERHLKCLKFISCLFFAVMLKCSSTTGNSWFDWAYSWSNKPIYNCLRGQLIRTIQTTANSALIFCIRASTWQLDLPINTEVTRSYPILDGTCTTFWFKRWMNWMSTFVFEAGITIFIVQFTRPHCARV